MKKIYNGFLFFNEFNMLDIRLHELWDVVDKFILVECPQTHRAGSKPLYFDERKKEYEQYSSKLIHIIHDLPNDSNAWVNERSHRQGIMKGVEGLNPDDYLIINDADEIPRASAITQFKGEIGSLMMKFFYYKFNMKCDHDWGCSKMVRFGAMNHDINYYRYGTPNSVPIPNAGWHFSKVYCMANLKYMFKECLADNLNTDYIMNNIDQWAKEGITDWCGQRNEFKKVAIDETFPEWFRNNLELFKNYIA